MIGVCPYCGYEDIVLYRDEVMACRHLHFTEYGEVDWVEQETVIESNDIDYKCMSCQKVFGVPRLIEEVL